PRTTDALVVDAHRRRVEVVPRHLHGALGLLDDIDRLERHPRLAHEFLHTETRRATWPPVDLDHRRHAPRQMWNVHSSPWSVAARDDAVNSPPAPVPRAADQPVGTPASASALRYRSSCSGRFR